MDNVKHAEEKSAVQRMNEYIAKCNMLGKKLFDFEYDEEADTVTVTQIYMSDYNNDRRILFPRFVSCVEYAAWHDNYMLKDCMFYIPKGCIVELDFDDTTEVRYFGQCAKEIVVEDGHEQYAGEDGVLFNKNKTVLIAYPSAKEDEVYKIPDSVVKINNGAFFEPLSLKTLHIPQSVVEIKNCIFRGRTKTEVDSENTRYKSVAGSLYSKDGKILYHLSAYGGGKIKMEEGTVIVKEMYLTGDFEELYLPSTLEPIDGLAVILDEIMGDFECIRAPKRLKDFLENYEDIYKVIYY